MNSAWFVMVALGVAPPKFVESRIAVEQRIESFDVEDVDGDALADVLIVTQQKDGRRLALHRQRSDHSFGNDADWSQLLPAEVVAWALLDVREDPGRELVLLTPTGVLSVSFAKAGLAGNARVELRQPVFPEISEPDRLLRWPWVIDIDFDKVDELLLPELGGLGCFDVRKDDKGSSSLLRVGAVPSAYSLKEKVDLPRELETDDDDDPLAVDIRALRLFAGAESSIPRLVDPPLLDNERDWNLPHLGFWNADQRPDALRIEKDALLVQLQLEDGTFDAVRRIEAPAFDAKKKSRRFELEDMDGDDRSELIRITADEDGLEKQFEIAVSSLDSEGKIVEPPRALMLFKASDLDVAFRDANHDGRKDLVVNTTQLPSGISSLASIRVDVAIEVYLGQTDGSFSRKPDARFARTFTPEKLSRLSEAQIFHVSGDYDGDGLDDLVMMDDDGRLEIHRLEGSGGDLRFAKEPMMPPYPSPEPVLTCWAFDFTKDKVSDLCLRFEKELVMLVSVPSEQGGGQ